jgi:CRP-like cAMP-binding protein
MSPSDAFPTLTDAQLDRLRAVGTEEAVRAGDFLFREGDAAYDFFVVLDGEARVYEDLACERPIVPEPFGPGHFLGEAGLLLGFICTGAEVPDDALGGDVWAGQRPHVFETSVPGVFAVGDVRSGSTKRVAGAVGEGSVTVKAVHARLAAPPVTGRADIAQDTPAAGAVVVASA